MTAPANPIQCDYCGAVGEGNHAMWCEIMKTGTRFGPDEEYKRPLDVPNPVADNPVVQLQEAYELGAKTERDEWIKRIEELCFKAEVKQQDAEQRVAAAVAAERERWQAEAAGHLKAWEALKADHTATMAELAAERERCFKVIREKIEEAYRLGWTWHKAIDEAEAAIRKGE